MNPATTKIDWDGDVVKHYVRRQAWLPAAISQMEACESANRKPKYLTFCAAEAIDVFLFLMEGILSRDPQTDTVLDTYFCEKNAGDFNAISQLIGPHEQGFLGDFQDMMLFEDDEETVGLDLGDASRRYSSDLRRRLSIKERHKRLRCAVPFDVVNLDVCGTLFPPKAGVLSPMLRSIRTLLDWQTDFANRDPSFDSFTVFLTTHVERGGVNKEALGELIDLIARNGREFPEFGKSLEQRFGTYEPYSIVCEDFPSFYCIAVPKEIVSYTFDRGWEVTARFSGQYQRARQISDGAVSSTYSMLAWVGQFRRYQPAQLKLGSSQAARSGDYRKLINELTSETQDIDQAAKGVYQETKCDLAQVVSFREDYLAGIESNI